MNIKAKDLMIDDWVKCVDSTHTISMFAQVDAIEEGHDCILVKRDISNWFLDIKYLEPIPLTEEILVKNWFVQYGSKFTCGEISVIFTIKGFSFWSKHSINIAVDNGSRINNLHRYVHELQHVLRLCGIEKEIKL